MFWGLVLECDKTVELTVDKSFHVSMASLMGNTMRTHSYAEVWITYDCHKYQLCTFQENNKPRNIALDLNFEKGTKVSFRSKCNVGCLTTEPCVHLTGYYIRKLHN